MPPFLSHNHQEFASLDSNKILHPVRVHNKPEMSDDAKKSFLLLGNSINSDNGQSIEAEA